MPTFRHGRGTVLLLDDEEITAFFREASIARVVDLADSSTFGTFDKTYVVGMRDARFTLGGLFDGSVDAIDEQLATILGQEAAVPFTYAPEGLTIGRRVYVANIEESNYEVSSPLTDIVATSAELQATAGAHAGVALHAMTAETATGSSTGVDSGVTSTLLGAVATLHLVTNTRDAGSIVVKVQDSADGSVWADLAGVTFASVAAGAANTSGQLLSVAGTVRRHLRASWTVTGGTTGAYTFAVACARKNV